MKRVAIMIAILALLLPIAAWADGIDLTNSYGTVNVTLAGIISKGSELTSWGGYSGNLGQVNFSTGAFTSGGVFTGGTLSATGSMFDVIGVGPWAKKLTGAPKNPVTLFSGSFVGPIQWTMVSHNNMKWVFTLSGNIQGALWNGRTVTGTTTQTIILYQNQWGQDQTGLIGLVGNNSHLNTPEPGTLGMFGTGLIAL